jgi:hypothetical protein
MKKNRLVFYAIFSCFHLFLFFFSLYVDSQQNNIQFLLTLQSKIWLLKYGSLFGLSLLTIDLVWDWKVYRAFKKENDQLHNEINNLKAKLFDFQEASRGTTAPKVSDLKNK